MNKNKTASRFYLLVSLLLASICLPGHASTLEKQSLLTTLSKMYENNIQMYMFMYDKSVIEHQEQAEFLSEEIQHMLPALIEAYAQQNPEKGEDLGYLVQDYVDSIPQILDYGYDASLSAMYETGYSGIVEVLFSEAQQHELSIEEEANLILHHILSSYVHQAAATFGSYTVSFNVEGMDIASLSTRYDELSKQLNDKYKNSEYADDMRSTSRKWQFMRAYIERSHEQSLPFIVTRYAQDMFITYDDIIASMQAPAADSSQVSEAPSDLAGNDEPGLEQENSEPSDEAIAAE